MEKKMQLTTCNPRRNLRPAHHDFTFFNDFFAPFSGITNDAASSDYRPSVDIYEKDDKLCLEAELPGFDKENIKVDMKGRLLTIGGGRVSSEDVKDENRYRKERRYGSFERSFILPFEVTEEQINATYKDGVLTLRVDKPEIQKAKQITIN